MVGIHIEQVVVGVNANQVQLLPCHGVVAVSNEDREIGNEDVLRVLDAHKLCQLLQNVSLLMWYLDSSS